LGHLKQLRLGALGLVLDSGWLLKFGRLLGSDSSDLLLILTTPHLLRFHFFITIEVQISLIIRLGEGAKLRQLLSSDFSA